MWNVALCKIRNYLKYLCLRCARITVQILVKILLIMNLALLEMLGDLYGPVWTVSRYIHTGYGLV